MEDTGAILLQISTLKGMLDKVNDEIEANIQITREIESEIVKIDEIETALEARESELMKLIYLSQYELTGLIDVTVNSRKSVAALTEEINHQRKKKDDLLERLNKKRCLLNMETSRLASQVQANRQQKYQLWENFSIACIEFQKKIESEECNKLREMLLEKESLEDEIQKLDQTDTNFIFPVTSLSEEILEDLHSSNSALATEIQGRQEENEQLLKEIKELRSTLLSTISDVDDPW